jgi:predicted RNase H-like nuclease (RuvC/YqgF family)
MTLTSKPPAPTLGDRGATFAARAARLLLRLLFILLAGIGLGLGVYLGIPALYRRYIEPVQVNTDRIVELEDALAFYQEELHADRADLNGRLAQIEGQLASQAESLAAIQADLAADETRLDALGSLPRRIQALEADVEDTGSRLAALEADLADAASPTRRLERRLEMIRALEALTRARLWLIQDNLGLASGDIQFAIDILTRVAEEAPEVEAEGIASVIDRLNQAVDDLPDSPVVASDDLEIAWRELVDAAAP